MREIIELTTPTIIIKFSTIDPANLTQAKLTIKTLGSTIISRSIDTATIDEQELSWTLTQTETKQLTVGSAVRVMCDWKLQDGTRGRSQIANYTVGEAGFKEVM